MIKDDYGRRTELVLLDQFSSDAAAHIVAGMLEAHDIPVTLDNEVFSSVLPIGFNSIGGIRMMVRRSDLEEARRLLANHHEIQ